jgi:hypothetical protein
MKSRMESMTSSSFGVAELVQSSGARAAQFTSQQATKIPSVLLSDQNSAALVSRKGQELGKTEAIV